MEETSLLYPAYQKFYSALSSLDRFSKENNFYDNISSLDTFFSEFRNITFVMQKSLAHTPYIKVYEKTRNKYLLDCKWLVEKRNETTKEQPFRLVKQIEVTEYLPHCNSDIFSKNFTVDNDKEFSVLLKDIKSFFKSDFNEVFFSIKFSFFENDNPINIYTEINKGIQIMLKFLNIMSSEIAEKCELSKKLKDEIKEKFLLIPEHIFSTLDYMYYPKTDIFYRGDTCIAQIQIDNTPKRKNLLTLKNQVFKKNTLSGKNVSDYFSMGNSPFFIGSDFENFIKLNLVIQVVDQISTIVIIYKNKAFELDLFHSDIKTTLYRKIKECADKIKTEEIKEIYFMLTYTIYKYDLSLEYMTSKERAETCQGTDCLVFMKMDNDLNKEEYSFNENEIKDSSYALAKIKYGKTTTLNIGRNNMLPIIEAFKQKKEK